MKAKVQARALLKKFCLGMQDAFDHDAYSKIVLQEEAELFQDVI